jgi:hypothetical protein
MKYIYLEKKLFEIINKDLLTEKDMSKLRKIVCYFQNIGIDILFEEGLPYYFNGEFSCAIINYKNNFRTLKIERIKLF